MAIVEHFVHVHTSVSAYTEELFLRLRRSNHVSPKHYLDFIDTYLRLLEEKNAHIRDQVRADSLQLTEAF
jgi:dynein heavy chain